jgi:N-acetyl-gamma-glutamyl-phosphate reductase
VTVDENVVAYKVAGHRHAPEIDQELAALGAQLAPVTFLPHLVPVDQGELITAYVRPARDVTQAELDALYRDAYADEPFVELADKPPGMHDVENTNICRVSVHGERHDGRVVVLAAIDNLWKGTSSQAVQNLNLMFGFPEGEGIA